MDKKSIGSKIRFFRKKAGLTIEQLAERTGLSDNFIGNIERGNDTPSLQSMLKIANALGIGMDCILGKNLLAFSPVSCKQQDFIIRQIIQEIEPLNEQQQSYILQCIRFLKNFPK